MIDTVEHLLLRQLSWVSRLKAGKRPHLDKEKIIRKRYVSANYVSSLATILSIACKPPEDTGAMAAKLDKGRMLELKL